MKPVTNIQSEDGFGLVELLIAMVVLQVALLALVGAFGAGSAALGHAAKTTTAGALADQQMELYRAMPYAAIGLDTVNAPTTGSYISDTSVCPTGQTPACGNSGPVDNSGGGSWSCTAATGATSVKTYFTASNINPCDAHRSVSGVTSPDSRSYSVDTYVEWGALIGGSRQSKQVSVVVRDGTTSTELAKQVTTFDCSTGNPANTAPC